MSSPSSDDRTHSPQPGGSGDDATFQGQRLPFSDSPHLGSIPLGTIVAERYTVEAFAGKGGMGEVTRTWDSVLGRVVALKALRAEYFSHPEALTRLRREAMALAQLSHPNVCQVYDWVEPPGAAYVAMEWMEGQTLDKVAERLDRRGKLRVLRQIISGLEAAHQKGLVHRDLKPSNVMVSEEGIAKVLDFGLALSASQEEWGQGQSGEIPKAATDPGNAQSKSASRVESHSWDRITKAGTFMGSPGYASPEQILGREIGGSSDLFSFGILAWELLSGHHPYPYRGQDLLKAIRDGRRSPMPSSLGSRRLRHLVHQLLSKDPLKRPTASEAGAVFDQELAPRKPWRWALSAAAAVSLIGSGGTWLYARGAIADLTRTRAARVALLPLELDPILASGPGLAEVLNEFMEAGLRVSPNLVPIGGEEMARALAQLRVDPKDPRGQPRLLKALGADLLLATKIRRTGTRLQLDFSLADMGGRIRTHGQLETEDLGSASALPLARETCSRLLKAIQPLGPTQDPGLPKVEAQVLRDYAKGRSALNHGNYAEALPDLKRAAFQAPDFSPAVLAYARCLGRVKAEPSEPVYQWAISAARAQGNRLQEVYALTRYAGRLRENGDRETSLKVIEMALSLAQRMEAKGLQASLHNEMGVILHQRSKPDQAELRYQQALALAQLAGDPLLEARIQSNLAVMDKERGRFDEAERSFRASLAVARNLEDRRAEGFLLHNLGDLAQTRQRLEEAETLLRQSLTLREATGDGVGRIYTLFNLTGLEQARGRLPEGLSWAHKALESARSLNVKPLEAHALYNLGEFHREMERWKEAREAYRECQALSAELNDPALQGHGMAGQAECEARQGHPPLGRALLRKASLLNPDQTPYMKRAEAWVLRAEGQEAAAQQAFKLALSQAKKEAPEILRELHRATE